MERKNQISTFLMVVGIIFILVAGSIFVTTAWQYLPEFCKQLVLLGVAGGLFAGSYKVSKYEKLKKTQRALFYLGDAFVGFFTVAILGGMNCGMESIQLGAFKMLIAAVCMTIPVVIKFVIRKRGFEFSVLAVLVNSILMSGYIALEVDFSVYLLLFGSCTVGLSVLDFLNQRKMEADKGLSLSIKIVYLVQAVVYGCFAIISTLTGYYSEKCLPAFMILLLVVITVVTWKARQEKVFQILNSLAVMLFIYVLFGNLNDLLKADVKLEMVCFIAFVVNLVVMVFVQRKEMFYIQVVSGMVIPLLQFCVYSLDSWSLFGGVDETWSTTYYPFSFCLAAAFAILAVYSKAESIMEQGTLLKIAGLHAFIGSVMWIASKNQGSLAMVFYLIVMADFLYGSIVAKKKMAKAVFNTLALFAGELALMCQRFLVPPDGYEVEWYCFILSIGIVLLPHIWYDMKKEMHMVRFVLTCILLGILLLSNLVNGAAGIGNVLILGGIGLIMLIVAAIRNQKEYVIASSVTLLLLVFYITREFWFNIEWWVYLFAAGVILVALAIKKEKEA